MTLPTVLWVDYRERRLTEVAYRIHTGSSSEKIKHTAFSFLRRQEKVAPFSRVMGSIEFNVF